ncbi:MAG: hypothetical protein GX063_07795 [Firmicutes bacterium]|nr:hypothetical protein [Bacillota bacterium]
MGRHRGLLPSYSQVLKRRTRRRLPRQLLRNLGLFYLVLAAGAGLLVLSSTRPDFFQEIGSRARIGFYWVRDKGTEVLPMAFNNLQLTTELSRSILAEGLPDVPAAVPAASSQLSPETLRSIVEAVTDYDLAEPESLVAGAFPGSRGTDGSLRWDWIIQRGIQGYRFPLPDTGKSQTGSPGKGTAYSQGGVEVVITAPEYAALTGETLETWPSSQGQTPIQGEAPVVTYEAKPPALESAAVPAQASFSPSPAPSAGINPAERLASLARVNWGNSPLIAIYHTHTGEGYRDAAVRSSKSYTWDFAQPGMGPVPGVVQVGERLSRELERRYGIPVVHSTKVHDYPVFAYSYANSEKTARMLVDRYPSLQLVIDIHRDEGLTMETMGGRNAAGVLIVVGAGGGPNLRHVNWRKNLETAELLKENFDRLYPGLCRGIRIKENARYNQHLHPGALLLEIGAHSDTLESALFTADLVADVLAETLWQIQSGSRNNLRGVSPGTGTYGIHPAGPGIQIEIFEPKSPRTVPRN